MLTGGGQLDFPKAPSSSKVPLSSLTATHCQKNRNRRIILQRKQLRSLKTSIFDTVTMPTIPFGPHVRCCGAYLLEASITPLISHITSSQIQQCTYNTHTLTHSYTHAQEIQCPLTVYTGTCTHERAHTTHIHSYTHTPMYTNTHTYTCSLKNNK